jgi:hypothetical protein
MSSESDRLLAEIKQIKQQYQHEVGSKRRPWPRSIRDRISALEKMGVSPREISDGSGVPYHTILQWKFLKRKLDKNKSFHPMVVNNEGDLPVKSPPTVTVKTDLKPSRTVTVTTPLGFRIEGSAESVCKILKSFRGSF